jgi:N-acetylneuraminic acid mutarotase
VTPKGWRAIAPASSAGIAPRQRHAAFWTGKEMLVIGGDPAPIGNWGAYDPALNTWRKLPAPPSTIAPSNLLGPAVPVLGDGFVFLSFGVGGAIFDLTTETWSVVADAPGLVRRAPAVTAWVPETKELVIWGGGRNSCPCVLADGAAYSPATKTWRALAASPLAARDNFLRPSAVVVAGKLVIYGGGSNEGARFRDAAAYDAKLDTWTMLPAAPAELAAYDTETHAAGARALFWAGSQLAGSTSGYATNTGAIWDPTTTAWTSIAGPANESPVNGFKDGTSFMAGNVLYAWGGTRYFKLSSTGYVYDLTSKAWSAMAPGGPTARMHPSSAWTGSEAIVWGGKDDTTVLGDGAIWRP